ncbi:right-handed parallel beta-helix repeat-containing protein [Paenibacillus silvisoli]|uniref:right-handed parallel beta-helix repeat-containing protein n=1 Tax=Paenibacillus silvisoli TaxID=3110539 RepID=UPI0028038DAC|nr:glycosyl hydrolase family 28-related protein [Paenibacillus silvisoli]
MNDANDSARTVNVADFGAAGNGYADDTMAVQMAVESLAKGGTVRFPAGRYVLRKRIFVNADGLTLVGEGSNSELVYDYEQKDSDDELTASLFVFREGIRGVTVRGIKVMYKGHFFPRSGESYAGKVSGFFFRQCFDVRMEHVEISGFNASGITIQTFDSGRYAGRVRVFQCYLHHNRVAGVLFGNVDGISIIDCDLVYNGSVQDGGTGYGCAGFSRELPRNIQLIGNRANYNYRKGLDLHAGIGAVIEGNLCHGNRLYGIYAEGSKTGNIAIRGNIISGMGRDKLDLPEPYTWIMGIDFGPYAESLVPEGCHNYIVEGNQIVDFGLEQGDAYPINCYFNMASGNIQICHNVIKATAITHAVRMRSIVPEKESGERRVQVSLSGNQIAADRCSDELLYLPHCDQAMIVGNQISVGQAKRGHGFLKLREAGSVALTCGDNHLRCADWTGLVEPRRLSRLKHEGSACCRGNFLNGRRTAEV